MRSRESRILFGAVLVWTLGLAGAAQAGSVLGTIGSRSAHPQFSPPSHPRPVAPHDDRYVERHDDRDDRDDYDDRHDRDGRHDRDDYDDRDDRDGRHDRDDYDDRDDHDDRRPGGHGSPGWGDRISGNQLLQFSDFHVSGLDPADIDLEVLSDGLRFSGPVSLLSHGYEFFTISYKVTALDPTMPIAGVVLELESSTEHYGFSKVLATKTVLGKGNAHLPELEFLDTYDIGDAVEKRSDEETFETARNVAYVWDKVTLFSTGGETTWFASTNRFSNVPEPGTASLLGLGLAGLVAAGRRRR